MAARNQCVVLWKTTVVAISSQLLSGLGRVYRRRKRRRSRRRTAFDFVYVYDYVYVHVVPGRATDPTRLTHYRPEIRSTGAIARWAWGSDRVVTPGGDLP